MLLYQILCKIQGMQSEVQKLKLSAGESENSLLTNTLGIPLTMERADREYSQ